MKLTTAARALGISRRLLAHAIAIGDVKTISFAGSTFIPHSEVARVRKLFEQGTKE
jgi:hypothetical protein